MAKRSSAGGTSQAAAIREAFGEHGIDAPSRQIAEYVDEKYQKGLLSKPNFSTIVSVERSKLRGGGSRKKRVLRRKLGRRGPGRPKGSVASASLRSSGSSQVQDVAEFIQKVAGGDAGRAVEILQAYRDLEKRLK